MEFHADFGPAQAPHKAMSSRVELDQAPPSVDISATVFVKTNMRGDEEEGLLDGLASIRASIGSDPVTCTIYMREKLSA